MWKLRPYQEEAITSVMVAMERDRRALLQAATGAGKTIIFCELIRRWMEQYPTMRIAILAHRRELVSQARDKLLSVWPEGAYKVGLACAAMGGNTDLSLPVTVGSIQTLARRAKRRPFHLIIIDEAHRLPSPDRESQYGRFLTRMEEAYPDLRILGVTATPFRLGHGFIYGDRAKRSNWFSRLDYQISISDLQAQGYLVPIRAKEAEDVSAELQAVKTSGGDYNLGQLSHLMSREVHIRTAVEAYERYGEDRRHCVVFCVSIRHAELVVEAFNNAGYAAAAVHSEMGLDDRDRRLADFATGRLRVLANVGVLTEGWDRPETDLVLLARPTKSPALFVQMVGRGTRLSPGKADVLVLDLADNFRAHGDPDAPRVRTPGESKSEAGEAPTKICPECKTVVPAGRLDCPECGFAFDPPELKERQAPVQMTDVDMGPKPVTVERLDFGAYTSKAGNTMARLTLMCRTGGLTPAFVNLYLDFEGQGSAAGQMKARDWWRRITGSKPPETVTEAVARVAEIKIPDRVMVRSRGRYLQVAGW